MSETYAPTHVPEHAVDQSTPVTVMAGSVKPGLPHGAEPFVHRLSGMTDATVPDKYVTAREPRMFGVVNALLFVEYGCNVKASSGPSSDRSV